MAKSPLDMTARESIAALFRKYDLEHLYSDQFQHSVRLAADEGLLYEALQSALSPEQLSSLRNEPILLRPLLLARLRSAFQRFRRLLSFSVFSSKAPL